MDPDSVKSTLSNLAFGNVMAAAARDYQKEVLAAQEKAQASSTSNQEVDLDELMDDPELEKLHADRIAALKREAEKRQALKKQGHGEYREITEGDFLGEVTSSEKVICHFYHREFYRCKILDKHLKSLAPRHVDTKFVRLDAENAPFFVGKLGIKTLPCVILFRQCNFSWVLNLDQVFVENWFGLDWIVLGAACSMIRLIWAAEVKGIAGDRLVGFQDLGGKDDFPTKTLEAQLLKKGIISEKKVDEEDNEYDESRRRTVRSSQYPDSDSD